ncbi:galactose transporter [Penicillium angulare]|uniref:galactose transporter n=1 Tax=Penicillium angulare TaxID=116970 RepID=UPI002540922D|nr:galactose transporter [Penicillium angulare]KAJ5273135.1 galactose transporter [Penicillium angulare]
MGDFEHRYAATVRFLELGAMFEALSSSPLADKFSRKRSISAWCIVFMLAVAHAIVAVLISQYRHAFLSHKNAGNAATFFMNWIVVDYAMPYGPVGWIIAAESSSLDICAKGLLLALQ